MQAGRGVHGSQIFVRADKRRAGNEPRGWALTQKSRVSFRLARNTDTVLTRQRTDARRDWPHRVNY
jgi:hypothetical protein